MPTTNSGGEQHRRGLPHDLERLKHSSVATASELREFVGQMRGRSPQQVLGAVAQSSLVRSVMLASVGCLVLMVAMTLVPYAWGKARPQQPVPGAAPAVTSTPASTHESSTAPSTAGAAATAQRPTDPSQLDDKTLKRLGVEQAVPADPRSNPLEDKGDDLLNGLK